MALLYDIPDQQSVAQSRKVKVLSAPTGLHDIQFDDLKSKNDYLEMGFYEVKIGIVPIRTQAISRYLQAQWKQYALRDCVTYTIHASMGETLNKVAMQITDAMFELWDKAQIIVALTRNKLGKNIILVGDVEETINAIVQLVQTKCQWTDYMENILNLITVDSDIAINQTRVPTLNLESFPFRICDISLPKFRTGFVYFLIAIRTMDYTYIGEYNSKKVNTFGYKQLFLLRIICTDESTPHMVYILEDDINHSNLWNHFVIICDNGGITIGTVLRLFGPKLYEDIMPDGVPSIVTRFPVAIMKQPMAILEVHISYAIQGGSSMEFCLNACNLTSISITAEESGCAGLFCDKKRVLEVRRYNDGCCCYSFDSRQTNMVVDHALNSAHHSLPEKIYASNYSSVQFLLLYQSLVFSSQVRQTSLDLTYIYFKLEDAATGAIGLINENGGFTVTGWYKRGIVTDCTILYLKTIVTHLRSQICRQTKKIKLTIAKQHFIHALLNQPIQTFSLTILTFTIPSRI